jgi:Mg2+ and Co2+ transporter CorA
VYSLLAQRDNDHSLKLAQLSQKQNNINIQISKFAAYESRLSNRMAKASLKYGVDMQVIAAVTLLFLPGTFIATLFSTNFWNFQQDNQGRVVSKWVWLYWVVTAVLTSAVLAAWRIVSSLRTDGLELPPELDLGTLPEIDGSGELDEKELV